MVAPTLRPLRYLALLFALLARAACATTPGYADYLAWSDWARVEPETYAGLASSWDRTGGHFDANQYESPPGLVLEDLGVVAATLTGPGVVDRVWMTHAAASQPFAIRMYFDGETTPRLETTSDALLGAAYSFFAAPFVTTFAGGQVSYEPIPFRESLRIETENRSGRWHWYQYNYRRLPPSTDVESWTGALDPETADARLAATALFESVGDHPAGFSATAFRLSLSASEVAAGDSRALLEATGPGTIRWIGLMRPAATDADLDGLHLRVTYEGYYAPAIDAAVSDFFGAGHGRAPYKSMPIGTDSPDGFYCYWPMPFHDAAKVELVNASAFPIRVDSAFVEVEPGDPGPIAGHFHAEVKDYFRPSGDQWNVLLARNGTGHYVGNFLFVEQDYASHSFLEGDDLVIVDGADSLCGTGLEDAYNGGSYYNRVTNPLPEPEGVSPPFAFRPLCGILRVEKTTSPPYARADQFRWRIADRVPFRSALAVLVQTGYGRVLSHWRSVVFWYELPQVGFGESSAPEASGVGLALHSLVPNPAAHATTIRFSLREPGRVVVELLDVRGRRLETLRDTTLGPGDHELAWRRGTHPSGVYFVRVASGDGTATRKLVLID